MADAPHLGGVHAEARRPGAPRRADESLGRAVRGVARRLHQLHQRLLRDGHQPRAQVPQQDLHRHHGLRGQEAGVHPGRLHGLRCQEGPDEGADRRDAVGQPLLRHEDCGRGRRGGRRRRRAAAGHGPAEAQLPHPRRHGGREVRLQGRPRGQEPGLQVLRRQGLPNLRRQLEAQLELPRRHLRPQRLREVDAHDAALQRVQPLGEQGWHSWRGVPPLQPAHGVHEAGPPEGPWPLLRHVALRVHHAALQGWLRWRPPEAPHRAGDG
mmetsp:Transcript_122279/g.342273  ORF Transcript_122279/g.342273 Transcript_122279/m.342273 type:complete len:267 (-) Transcript_122279:259-1059(-)